jgi:hypothetical protein
MNYAKQLSKNKALEIEAIKLKNCYQLFDFSISHSYAGDHAGFRLTIQIYKLFFEFSIYDCRHWDYDKAEWEVYGD